MKNPSWFFWVVAVIAFLWGAFGVFDFWMTVTGNEAYLQDFPPEMIAWIQGFPLWRTAMWAVGVACGFLGGLLLILRRALAVPFLWLGVALLLVGFVVHDLLMANGAEMYGAAGLVASVVICIVTVAIAWYAGHAKAQGFLR